MPSTLEDRYLEILESHKRLIFKVAYGYTNNAHDRKDLIQKISLQLWKALPKFNDSVKISTWIYRIALNVSISFLRKEGTRKKHREPYEYHERVMRIEPPSPDGFGARGDRCDEMEERLQQLYKYIEDLRPVDKAIIIMHFDKLNYDEIAEVMGLTPTNVGTKINRIKKLLTEKFKSTKS